MDYSIYSYLFNATLRDFDAEAAIGNFTSFAAEVVIATIVSQDDTRERLARLEKLYPSLRVIESNIVPEKDNRFDGRLKTLALKACTKSIRVIADCDERFVLSQRPMWESMADQLIKIPPLDGLLVPVIDLWGSKDDIKAGENIGQKFRMHKMSIVERGVVKGAEWREGRFDTSRSDSTEPLTYSGQLGVFGSVVEPLDLNPLFARGLRDKPYVVHYGSLDLQRRAKIGKEFWKARWEERSGRQEQVATDVNQFKNQQVIKHGLELE